MRVVPFARSTRDLAPGEEQNNFRLTATSGEAGRATDLEAAVREAIASLPAGMVPRVALISDGKENKGSIARAAWQAQQLGIPIDTFALAGRAKPALRLESVSLPSIAFTGEQFPIDVVVSSPSAGPAQVELSAEGKPLGQTSGESESRRKSAASARQPEYAGRARYLGSDPRRSAGRSALRSGRDAAAAQGAVRIAGSRQSRIGICRRTLTAAQFDVTRVNDPGDIHLNDYQLVIFNNWDLEAIPAAGKQALETVRQAGRRTAGHRRRAQPVQGRQKSRRSPGSRVARQAGSAALARRHRRGADHRQVLVDGRPQDGAGALAAIGVVENLRPIDQVGVLIFDNSFEWAVPIRRAEDKALIKRLISGITPDGGTQIAPALTEAFRRIRPVNATYKHIVLLTDGISEEGDSMTLAKEAEAQKVTISTVGLGQDVNRSYLERVAIVRRRKIVLPDRAAGPGANAAARRAGAYRIDHGGASAGRRKS